MSPFFPRLWRWTTALLVAGAAWLSTARVVAQVVLQPGMGMPDGQAVPTAAFDLALGSLSAGDFMGGLEIASVDHRGGIRVGTQRWIDSIATSAAIGECHYELGNLREAAAAYDEALLLSAAHADWLLAVQFTPQGLRPLPQQRVATWGRSQRNTTPAGMPSTVSIRQGGADPQQVLQRGGMLAAQVNFPVRPQEIMRSLVIALYRRGVILGDLAREGAAIDEAVKALLRRSAPPNHYSQSWIDVALGTALWSQGKLEQAQPLLTRGLLVGNQLDHSLTCWGLIVLGRIALAADQPAAAARLFEEATYTAADYGDARALEEAFRLAAAAHLAAGTRGVPATIRGGTEWTRTNLPVLRATLLGLQAEALAVAGDPRAGAAALSEIDGRLMRGDPGRGLAGGQQGYAAAMVAYSASDTVVGDRELERALAIVRRRSPALFQATRLVEMLMAGAGGISDRQADALFSTILGDPTPRDVAIDPLGTLVAVSTPRSEAFEAWITAAGRRGSDAALNASEATVRSRWMVAQPLGGRRIATERLLIADPNRMPRVDATLRAAVLGRHPDLAAILNNMARVRAPLTAALLAAAGPLEKGAAAGVVPGDPQAWREYQQLAGRSGQYTCLIAAGRDAPPIDMPPLTPAPEIRRRLSDKQLILSFRWTASGLFGALESHDRAATWSVRQPAAVAKEIVALAKAMCLFDPIAPVSTERLLASDWQGPAERIERLLFEDSKVVLAEGIQELVIVPDGLLWYLPFELLPVGSARPVVAAVNRPPKPQASSRETPAAADPAAQDRLHDVCRIRYSPTRSLAVLQFDPPLSSGPVGIYAGRLFRGDKPVVAQELATRLTASLDRAVALTPAPVNAPTTTPLVASLLDTLVVFDELSGDGPIAARALLAAQSGRSGMTFGDWLSPPAKRPRCVVLPGLQTALAGGLSKLPVRPGEDLFLAVTDVVAAGGRTALLSRWRMGGKISVDLVEEFLRDRDHADAEPPPASESWRRSVEVATSEEPDVSREPRVKQTPQHVLPDARHPFFWAGYILVDCGLGRYSEPPPGAGPPVPRPAPAPAAGLQPPPAMPQPVPRPPAARGPLNPAAQRE